MGCDAPDYTPRGYRILPTGNLRCQYAGAVWRRLTGLYNTQEETAKDTNDFSLLDMEGSSADQEDCVVAKTPTEFRDSGSSSSAT